MRIRTALVPVAAAAAVMMGAGAASADATAFGSSNNSPGLLSGNTIEAPINIPINLCGDSIDVIGLLNPTVGDTCVDR